MSKFLPKLSFMILIFTLLTSVMMGRNALASEHDQAEETEDSGGAEKSANELYIKVPPLAVSMYHKGRTKGNMTVSVTIKLLDKEKRAEARKIIPRLSNAYVIEATRLSYNYFDVYKSVNVAMIGDAFQRVTNKILHHNEAQVFISNVIVNKK